MAFARELRSSISIHALREEGDSFQRVGGKLGQAFLSTPSARRATGSYMTGVSGTSNFYPRPPRGGRQTAQKYGDIIEMISIHALREEGDVSGPVLVSTS